MVVCFKMPRLVISILLEHQFVHIYTQLGQVRPLAEPLDSVKDTKR